MERYGFADFIAAFLEVADDRYRKPVAIDWYYHESCRDSGAGCSVHQLADCTFVHIPIEKGRSPIVCSGDTRGSVRGRCAICGDSNKIVCTRCPPHEAWPQVFQTDLVLS